MRLYHSHTSPYVRKVVVLLHETGLADRVRIATVDGWSEPQDLIADNPLSMVPTLVLDDGRSLYDSPAICDYLDHCHPGPPLIPAAGEARWQALREQALADGILDCAIAIFLEQNRRPAHLRWDAWATLKERAIGRALDRLEGDAQGLAGRVDLGTIAIACALGYLDLRGAAGPWRADRGRLAAWYADFARRPSMVASAPPV